MWGRRGLLTPPEYKQLRTSLSWVAASAAVFMAYLVVVLLDGVPGYAKLFGVPEHHVWVYLSELVPIPFFLASLVCWGLSVGFGVPLIGKRPVCLVWIVGPPVLLFVGLPLLIGTIALLR